MRRRNISPSVQRSIDRLLKNSMEDKENERIIDDDGKIKFCRMKFDFELLEGIVENIKGFNFLKCKE